MAYINKDIFLLYLLIILSKFSYGQMDSVFLRQNIDWTEEKINYQTDTIIFKSGMYRHVILGTSIIPNTENQQNALGFGIKLDRVEKLDCDNNINPYKSKNRIESIVKSDSTLIIDLIIFGNCCYSYLCDIKIDSNKTLDLIFIGYGTYCACDCGIEMIYYLSRPNFSNEIDLESVILNGKIETKRDF